jgi:hypothetical protein
MRVYLIKFITISVILIICIKESLDFGFDSSFFGNILSEKVLLLWLWLHGKLLRLGDLSRCCHLLGQIGFVDVNRTTIIHSISNSELLLHLHIGIRL